MSGKSDEHLDQRIRQALDALPDAPPPGSEFEAGRLWKQLRGELPAQPIVAKKQSVRAWWLVAASLAGLFIGLVWWVEQNERSVGTQTEKGSFASERSVGTQTGEGGFARERSVETRTGEGGFARERSVGTQTGGETVIRSTGNLPKKTTINSYSSKIEFVKSTGSNRISKSKLPAADTNLSETAEAIEPRPALPEPGSLTVAVAVRQPTKLVNPKRRFQLVHENELPTVDEAHRVRHAGEGHAERFVRLGSGAQVSPALEDTSPVLLFPLNRKSTQ